MISATTKKFNSIKFNNVSHFPLGKINKVTIWLRHKIKKFCSGWYK